MKAVLPCHDCGVDTCSAALGEYYMVTDDVWAASGLAEDGGYLCIGCLETRLERLLTPDDFTDAPVNWLPDRQRSERLLARLS